MSQKYSNNEIQSLSDDWGRDTRDDKYRPYSNGAVQRFIKKQFQEQTSGIEEKIGWLSFEGGNIVMYDKQDGTAIGSITLSGTIYAIDILSDTKNSFYVLTTEKTKMITLTPSSKSGTLGGSMTEFVEDYNYKVFLDNGTGEFREIGNGTCLSGSSFTTDIRSYITTGTNRIKFNIVGQESGQSKSIVFTATVTNLSLTCNYSWHKPFIQGQNYVIDKIYFGGNLTKTLYVRVDGDLEQTYTKEFSSGSNYLTSDYQFNMTSYFPTSGSGIHTLEIWLVGDNVETVHYKYNMMCVALQDINSIPLVVINDAASEAMNYENQTLFKYATYNCNYVTFNIKSSDNGIIKDLVNDNTIKVNTGAKNNYDINLEIDTESREDLYVEIQAIADECIQTLEVPVNNNNAYAAADNPNFYMNAVNRNNGNSDRYQFINAANGSNATIASYTATWDGFSWAKDGWSVDDDGNKCLVVNAGQKVTLPDFKPLSIVSTFSETLEFKFRCSHIADYNSPIMTIMDTDTYNENTTNGIILFPTKIVVLSNGNRLITPQSVNLDEDQITHIAIVFQRNYKNNGRNLCRIYVNSIQNAVFEYGGSNHFGNGYLKIGQESADTYLYMLRLYNNRVLEESDILSNFMNSFIDTATKGRADIRRANAITDGGEINYDLCKSLGYNIMVVQTKNDIPIPSIEQTSSVSSTLSMEYAEHPEWNFTIENAPCDGQGTTSKKYYRWNLRWKLKDSSIWTYADGSTSTKSGYFDGNHPKVNKITAKKNIASSGQGHKMGATAMYDELYEGVGLKTDTLPNASTRVAVYQYPVMGFQKMSDGTYQFIGLYTIGPDKGDKKTFGYDDSKYPSYLSLEGPNHNPLATRFLHPWTSDTIYNPDAETLEFGGQEGWDVDACPYETDVASDQANIQALLESEWKPAYDLVYYCSPYIRSFSEVGYTTSTINNNIIAFRNDMSILGTRRNEVLQLYDTNYNLWYYDNTQKMYIALSGFNIVTYLNGYLSTTTPTTDQIIAARKAKFRAEASNYWDMDACVFHSCFCELTGCTDNHAKNSYPFKLKTLAQGGRWSFRQDDMDTIMATDNNGQSTKAYSIEVGDITSDGTDIFQGASSALWALVDDVYASEKKIMMGGIFDAIEDIADKYNISASYLHNTIYNVFKHYFWENSAEYFPSISYNKDEEWSYIYPWYVDPAKTYNNVYPLTQALGTQESAEQLWVKRRIIYIMSQYELGGFKGSANDGLGSIEFTPAQTFTFKVVPAIDMYPNANKGGGENVKGVRTLAGNTCDIVADSDGSTTFYLKGLDLLTDIGDLSGLVLTTRGGDSSVGASFSISAAKLKTLKVGDDDASKVKFNASSLTISSPCLEEINAKNVSTITNNISLLKCPRLKRVFFEGTNASSVNLPLGAMVEEISYPDGVQTLFLHSLPMLTDENVKLSNTSIQNITGLYFYNCPQISPFALLRRIYQNGSNLKFITMIWDGTFEGNLQDMEMLANFCTPYEPATGEGYGCIEYDADNNLISNSADKTNLQGAVRINGYAYEDTVNTIRNYFGSNLTIDLLGYYMRFADSAVESICATNWGDGTGITTEQVAAVAHFNGKFSGNKNITTFNEIRKFPNITEINSNNRFNSCTNLISINLGNITKISGTNGYERWNFESCTNLVSVGDTSRCTHFGQGAFSNCSKLAEVNLVNATYIGNSAFYRCVNLTTINCNLTKVETIGESAFGECSNISQLSTINLPNLKGSLHTSFMNCTQIQHITSLGSLSTLHSVFANDGAFEGCSGLLDVVLPETLTSIGLSDFGNCRNIRYIKILATSVPTYQLTNGFGNTHTYGTSFGEQYRNGDVTNEYMGYTYPIYVKDELLSQYKAADGWKYVGVNASRLKPLSQFATDFPNG